MGLSTVRDMESEKRAPDTGAAANVRRALHNGGVAFVGGGPDGGPGVRLVASWPNIIRRPTTMQKWEGLPFTIEWQGKGVTVFISREVLEDLDGHSENVPDDAFLKTFERHRGELLDAITLAIADPDNFDGYGRLYIRQKDLDALKAEPWHQVIIDGGDDVKDMSASALINKFASKFMAAGVPKNVEVFHGNTTAGEHIYYFSPKAATVAGDLLKTFGATPCPTTPNTSACKKIKL